MGSQDGGSVGAIGNSEPSVSASNIERRALIFGARNLKSPLTRCPMAVSASDGNNISKFSWKLQLTSDSVIYLRHFPIKQRYPSAETHVTVPEHIRYRKNPTARRSVSPIDGIRVALSKRCKPHPVRIVGDYEVISPQDSTINIADFDVPFHFSVPRAANKIRNHFYDFFLRRFVDVKLRQPGDYRLNFARVHK